MSWRGSLSAYLFVIRCRQVRAQRLAFCISFELILFPSPKSDFLNPEIRDLPIAVSPSTVYNNIEKGLQNRVSGNPNTYS